MTRFEEYDEFSELHAVATSARALADMVHRALFVVRAADGEALRLKTSPLATDEILFGVLPEDEGD
jgi:hypothetical protein